MDFHVGDLSSAPPGSAGDALGFLLPLIAALVISSPISSKVIDLFIVRPPPPSTTERRGRQFPLDVPLLCTMMGYYVK